MAAVGRETLAALNGLVLFSQYERAAETPVLVSQYRVMLSRTSSRVSAPALCPSTVCPATAETTAAAGCPQPSPWSRSQPARPTGESASPYSVCGRVCMNAAYANCFPYKSCSCWYACFSSAERVTGGGSPQESDFAMAGGTVAGKLVLIPSNPGGACLAINVVTTEPRSPPCATYC